MNNESTALPESVRLPFEANAHSVTPFFKHQSVLNVAQSETQGKPVYELMELVELRLAGDRNYSPVMPADSMYRKIGDRVVTYAERFADQYRAFAMGDEQQADGTALEMLRDYGITPAQLSICRALKIYSIEALDAVDGHQVKALGLNANDLKKMARLYMDDRTKRAVMKTTDDVEAMKDELARLRALIPAEQTPPAEIDQALALADAEFAAMSDESLKAYIKDKAGAAPRGTPGRDTLLRMAQEARDAA